MANITAVVQEVDLISVSTTLYNPPTIPRLEDIGNIDASNLTNGAVLVYKSAPNKWVSTTTLDLQNMEGGEF
jgi:hypothetical protein